MDKFQREDLLGKVQREDLRRLRSQLAAYSPQVLTSEGIINLLCDYAQGGTGYKRLPGVGSKRIATLYNAVWYLGLTAEQFAEGDI